MAANMECPALQLLSGEKRISMPTKLIAAPIANMEMLAIGRPHVILSRTTCHLHFPQPLRQRGAECFGRVKNMKRHSNHRYYATEHRNSCLYVAAPQNALVSALLVLLLNMPAYSQIVIEPDGYTKWYLTVPRETLVHIKSDFGNFNFPVGYLRNSLSFRQNPTALANKVAKFDVSEEQVWKSFAFRYWVPDGGMVWHREPQVRGNRPIEPGHLTRSKNNFVVNMGRVESVREKRPRRANFSATLERLDEMLPARPIFKDGKAVEGATRDGTSDKLLRFYLSIRNSSLCEGWFIVDRREMAMEIYVPCDASAMMFDAVKIAARLLDTWEDRASR
ncbi:MAG TPA: hypothetical protein VEI95_17250 [Acidobacteriota bacterium]|nr:hypothetical protein [Acidobacteriota bacterium]